MANELENVRLKRKRGSFGPLGNLLDNSCGAIALFHILQLSGETVTFREVVQSMQKRWWATTLLGGLCGTNPFYLYRELKRRGFHMTCYRVMGESPQIGQHSLYLNFYLHRKGAHYSVSRYEAGRLRTWNDPDSPDHAAYRRQVGALLMLTIGLDLPKERAERI